MDGSIKIAMYWTGRDIEGPPHQGLLDRLKMFQVSEQVEVLAAANMHVDLFPRCFHAPRMSCSGTEPLSTLCLLIFFFF